MEEEQEEREEVTAPAEAALPARTPRPAPSTEGPLRRVRKTGLRLRSLALPVAFTSSWETRARS